MLGTFLKFFLRQESRLASGIANNDPSLLGRLHVGLEVTSDAVSDRNKVELLFIKDVSVFGSKFQQALSELVVVLLLLEGVVERRVAEVFLSIGHEKGFEFCVNMCVL